MHNRGTHKAKEYTWPKSINLNVLLRERLRFHLTSQFREQNPRLIVLVQRQQGGMETVFAKSPCEVLVVRTERRRISAVYKPL